MKAKYLKNAAKRTLSQILLTVLALGLLAYVGYHVWRRITSTVNTEVAVSISVEDLLTANGFILRDEKPMFSQGVLSGSLVPSVADGEKVPVGGVVSKIYESYEPEIIEKLGEIEEKIQLLQDSLSGNVSFKDASKLDAEIQKQISQLKSALEKQDYAAVASVRKTLMLNMNKRELILGRTQNIEEAIDRLKAEALSLTNRLGACRETVKAPVSGYYYTETDGYETIFTPSELTNLTVERFRSLCDSLPLTNGNRFSTGKMVLSYEWRVCTEVPRESAVGFDEGKKYDVIFSYNNDTRVSMLLESRIISEDGKTVLFVFQTDKMPENFVYDRTQPISIVRQVYSGFQIPASAIRVVDSIQGVYVLDGSTVKFRALSIVAVVDDVYISETEPQKNDSIPFEFLQRNDLIITSGKGLYDGRVLS